MSRSSEELVPDSEQLGQKIGSAKSAEEVLKLLQESGYPLKPATEAILRAGDEVLRSGQVELKLDGKPMQLRYKLLMVDGGGTEWEARLKIFLPDELAERGGGTMNSDELNPGELAIRTLYFTQPGGDVVDIYSFSLADKHSEGKGLSLGLGLLSNVVIDDVIRRGCFSNGRIFRSTIQDAAYALDRRKNREGWSTTLAKLLGYTPKSEEGTLDPEFEKVFRV